MKKLKIDVLAVEGSPQQVTEQSIYGIDGRIGVGGAELGILTLCRLWHDAGHDVTFYNNPQGGGSEFKQARVKDFHPHSDRDVLIVFRAPTELVRHAKGRKIFYSNDQFTSGDYASFVRYMDEVVVISEFHKHYFESIYGIYNAKVIDIPIRTWDYPKNPTKKKNSCIFTSVPSRGLMELYPIWRNISDHVPDATLTITSDWGLWSGGDFSNEVRPFRLRFGKAKNVIYKSAVKREELIKIQSEAEFHLYPCTYDELFCISVAESQVAGTIPITSTVGALETTNRFGHKIEGAPTDTKFMNAFIDKAIEMMTLRNFEPIEDKAREEFSKDKVLAEWDKILYGNT
jgi:glycosyltransferase involved in cell wall biosynthesis